MDAIRARREDYRFAAEPENKASIVRWEGNTATINGSPVAGTGGQYLLRLANDGGTAGLAAQQLILNVNEAPKITSNAMVTMFVGVPGSLAVTTTGFPVSRLTRCLRIRSRPLIHRGGTECTSR